MKEAQVARVVNKEKYQMSAKLLDNEWTFINKILLIIHSYEDIDGMRIELLTLLRMLIKFDYASIYLYDNENEMLTRPIGYNLSQEDLYFYINDLEVIDPFRPLRKMFSDPNHTTIRAHDYALNAKVEDTEYYKAAWEPKGIKASLFAGLGYNELILGCISLYRKENNPDFSDRDIHIVNILKDHLNIRLWREKYKQKVPDIEMDIPGIKRKYGLTNREMEVIELWSNGLTDIEICQQLSISNNTLKKHISNIFRKLDITSRVEFLKVFPHIKYQEYNVPIKQDKNFEKLNEPDIIKNSKLSGKKVHKNG
jgi:DNA-binding CsgD family transcriptional regulator